MPRTNLYTYRAWPSAGLPHIEALHHMFGLGVAEIRIDTYIYSKACPNWLIVLHGAGSVEIREKVGEDAPLSAWKVLAASQFPLRHNAVKKLQQAFPDAQLSHKMTVPGDLISWLAHDTVMFTVSKRLVQFVREGCAAEFSQIETCGRRAETFSLTSKRYDTVMSALSLLPAPRLPNMDDSSWLHRRPWNMQAVPMPRADEPMPILGAAQVA